MATSDSEDFESADEWEDETGAKKEEVQYSTSVKSGLEVRDHTAEKSNALTSKNVSKEIEEDLLIKSLEKNVCIKENKGLPNVRTNSDVLLKDCEKDRNKILSAEHAKGDHTIEVKLKDGEPKPKESEKDEKSVLSRTTAEGDTVMDVKHKYGKPLLKESEDDSKQSHTHSEKYNIPIVKEECGKPSPKVSSDTVNLKSQVVSSDLNIEDTLNFEADTDGWDCEDEDLNDTDIEGSIVKDDMDSVLNKLSESVEKPKNHNSEGGSGWGSWGNWGVTSLLSTATESVSTLTNHVSQGLSTVLETGLGVPDPEELVKQEIEEEKKFLASVQESSELHVEKKKEEEESGGLFGFGRVMSGVSSITKLVETPITKVVSGGLDTLETIGKKTMEVLQEGDPGLRKKRAIFSDKVVLSQVLREAKDKAEQEDRALQNTEEARKVHFETLFDDYHGLVHLEALEMLSKQCNIKLQSVLLNTPSSDVAELQESIAEIKELCQLPDEEDAEGASFETLEAKLADAGKGLGVPIANEKLIKTWQEVHQWLQDCRSNQRSANKGNKENEKAECSAPSVREIHEKAISTLARLTAEAVEQFHKTAELLLVCENRNPSEEAKILLDTTSIFSLQVSTAATVFSENLNTSSEYVDNPDTVNSQITNVFLEAANSSSYIQEAFQLLVPVLQVGIVSS